MEAAVPFYAFAAYGYSGTVELQEEIPVEPEVKCNTQHRVPFAGWAWGSFWQQCKVGLEAFHLNRVSSFATEHQTWGSMELISEHWFTNDL